MKVRDTGQKKQNQKTFGIMVPSIVNKVVLRCGRWKTSVWFYSFERPHSSVVYVSNEQRFGKFWISKVHWYSQSNDIIYSVQMTIISIFVFLKRKLP